MLTSSAIVLLLVAYGERGSAQSELAAELDRIEGYFAQRDSMATDVSAVDVAWHLDHALKVIIGIYAELDASEPADYTSSFSGVRTLVFTLGRMPRGVGKSPESVLPPDLILTEDLQQQLATARSLLPKFTELGPKQHYDHYFFGVLNRKRAVRFLRIHTRHHLRIVRDIIKAGNAG